MPLIDGEKFACASCIKGHRVSGCTHSDRELHHINPKGRPVKQCEHCRGARKSKSHHAKCDCGDKKDKAKDKGDLKVDENSCCCHHGAKCICGLKKESLDLKLDTASLKLAQHGAKAKPRLTTTHSESTLTVFANGHHKPCHRMNNAAHISGAPYKIPRPHTLHGPSTLGHHSHDSLERIYGRSDAPAQRSVDTLSLSDNAFYGIFGSAQRSLDSLPLTPLTGGLEANGTKYDPPKSMYSSQPTNAIASQDCSSPSDSQLSDNFSQQWPWVNPIIPNNSQFGLDSLSTSPSQEFLPNSDNDWAIPSAGLNNPLWSAGDLPLDPSRLTNNGTKPISHSGESNRHSVPGLTVSSSGAQSENGESGLFSELDGKNPSSAVNDISYWDDTVPLRDPPAFRMGSASMANDLGPGPTSMPINDSRRSLDLDYLRRGNDNVLFEQEPRFDSDATSYQSPSIDDIQSSKALASPSTYTAATTQSDSSASYSPVDYNAPRSITIPNNIDDIVTGNPWLPLVDPVPVNFGGLPSLETPIDGGLEMTNSYPAWL
ncbi:hypothetical protein AOQ84DRAFT_181214 [Glonium stellatum]|uniref:Copper-fist domain-containing protein n=1 Tax=Glonium stellatum TaxID=574774 RepID=A0A8E2EPX1_9PEZI|nr:hypothetical protein AOQ84DRAFT_181214 [Glonium stellatum]